LQVEEPSPPAVERAPRK